VIDLASAAGPLAYVLVAVFAAVEGEIVFVAASALVAQGDLNGLGVVLAGAAGAAIGDQFYFFLLRGRLRRWIGRSPMIAGRAEALALRVRRHENWTVFAIRFSPGLRIALAAACAHADVPPLKFSLINLAASLIWAAALLALVAIAGPRWLPQLGISGWWAVLVPAVLVVLLLHGRDLARLARRLAAGGAGDGR
jgi:membrane protein DedA with SNARE-associated domain